MSKTLTPCYLGHRNGPNAKTTAFDSGKEINIQDRCRKWAGRETKTLYINPISAKSALSPLCLLTWCDSFDNRLWHLHPRNQKCNSLVLSERKLLAFCGAEKIAGERRPAARERRCAPRESSRRAFGYGTHTAARGSKRRRWSWI